MTAYRSSNDYRQDTLRYDGGTNATVAAATIAAVAAFPAVSIAVDQTVSVSTVATAATTPAVTVKTGVTVNVTTVSTSGLIPNVAITEGAGVTISSDLIATLATVPALTVIEGNGISVTLSQIDCLVTVPDPGLKIRIILHADAPGALLDVQPYHVTSIERRWKSRWAAPARRGKNIFILTDNTITNRHPTDSSTISRQILGGHESPTDLSSEEQTLLINAGYSFEVV